MSGRTSDAPHAIQRRMAGAIGATGRALVFLAVGIATLAGLTAAVLRALWWEHRARGKAGR